MKKILSSLVVFSFLTLGQGAFAWTYDGLGSLNPFTNFGRGFGNSNCGCQVDRCNRPKLTKCEKLHGVKIKYEGQPCGCAAPVIMPTIIEVPSAPVLLPTVIEQPMIAPCTNCTRAF